MNAAKRTQRINYSQPFLYVDQDWIRSSACVNQKPDEPDLFFNFDRINEAKQLCARCPVAWECLQYAATNEMHHGVWGGMAERERREFLQQNRWRLDQQTRTNHRRLITQLNSNVRRTQ